MGFCAFALVYQTQNLNLHNQLHDTMISNAVLQKFATSYVTFQSNCQKKFFAKNVYQTQYQRHVSKSVKSKF